AGFGLFEDRHDLAVGKSGLLHCSNFLVVEILLQLTAVLWGDYPTNPHLAQKRLTRSFGQQRGKGNNTSAAHQARTRLLLKDWTPALSI
ncbi:hypothetical protein, partial [Pollutimonas subterranea]|uniref:hypothetical protein n=1 Tax=Pollutimonas subterranea TaxID=2045210 RepID=UPI001E377A10